MSPSEYGRSLDMLTMLAAISLSAPGHVWLTCQALCTFLARQDQSQGRDHIRCWSWRLPMYLSPPQKQQKQVDFHSSCGPQHRLGAQQQLQLWRGSFPGPHTRCESCSKSSPRFRSARPNPPKPAPPPPTARATTCCPADSRQARPRRRRAAAPPAARATPRSCASGGGAPRGPARSLQGPAAGRRESPRRRRPGRSRSRWRERTCGAARVSACCMARCLCLRLLCCARKMRMCAGERSRGRRRTRR